MIDLLESAPSEVLREALAEYKLDLTFGVEYDEDWRGFEKIPFEDEFVVVVSVDGAKVSYGPRELADLPMIGQHLSDQCQGRIDAGLRSHGVEPRYVFRSGGHSAVQAMVRAGQGVAVMPILAIDTSDPAVVLRQRYDRGGCHRDPPR